MTGSETSKKLLSRAGRILSRRAYSRGELRRKLSRYGEPELIESVLERLEELNLLNDAEYAYNFALCRMKQDGWGPLKVLQALRRCEVKSDLAEEMVALVRKEAGDMGLLQEYLQRHCRKTGLPQDRKGLQRLVSHLRRRGFQEETIYDALRHLTRAVSRLPLDIGD